MHRLILGLSYGDSTEGDHRNRNRLDNRRSNLRAGTRALNLQNKQSYRGSYSSHRGVTWRAERGTWVARATLDGKTHYLGSFNSEDAAAEAATAWRREHMPFAMG